MQRWTWWRKRRLDDFDSEVEAHLILETDRLVAEGMSREEAARAARRAFGNVTTVRERYYQSRRMVWVDQLRQDLRAGARSLTRYPVAASVAVLSIAAGIGATTAFLTVRNFIFENPPPLYAAPGQLSYVQVGPRDRPRLGSSVPGDLFARWRTLPDVAIAGASAGRAVREVRAGERREPVTVRAVSPDLFRTLGVAPALGRAFTAAEPDGPEAILGYRIWQQFFDGREDAIGRTIWVEGRAHTVVGVMPARFWFSDMDFPVWTRLDPATLSERDEVQVVARRPEGMSEDALAAFLEPSLADYWRAAPSRAPLQLRVSAVKGTPIGNQMSALLPFLFAGSVFLTLLIACANVAILMIAQWTTRETETAVRTALGATRWRIVRGLLAESVVLAGIAGTLGVAATFAIRGIIISQVTLDEVFLNLAVDPAIFWQAAIVTILAGVLAGIGPALFETRRLQMDPLRGIATSDRVRQRWSHALVVLEITVTLALLVVATSMVDAIQRGTNADFGFDPDRFAVAAVTADAGLQTASILDLLSRMPGVEAVAAATAVPLGGRGPRQPVAANASDPGVPAERIAVSTAFFSTLGVPVLAGRTFAPGDSAGARTAVVNDTLAARLFAGAPVGRQINVNGIPHDVIGVVGDYTGTPMEQRLPMPKVFLPLSENTATAEGRQSLRFLLRAAADPAPLVQPLRRALEEAAPGIVVNNTYTMRQILTITGQEMLVGTAPFFPLIVIGMLLTSSGVYGVLAFAIARRSRELAIRVAIGAGRGEQLRLVGAHSARLLGLGLACGVALTFGLSRVVRAVGGGGSFYDPPLPAFVIPVVIVLIVGAIATWVPMRRVLRINAAALLRTN